MNYSCAGINCNKRTVRHSGCDGDTENNCRDQLPEVRGICPYNKG